jgi:hypothetical protein
MYLCHACSYHEIEDGNARTGVEVPYDPHGLQAAFQEMGFDGCDIIQEANTIPSIFHDGGYGSEIHEMSEMALNCWGQWELDNQPVWILEHMQVAFDKSVTGKCAGQAQKWLRQSNSMLRAGADMYPGDEDNGSMGAWFVMNMLGFYPVSPSSGNYTVGSPLFAQVTIDTGGAKPLIIRAKNQHPKNMYVQGLQWNGKDVMGTEIQCKRRKLPRAMRALVVPARVCVLRVCFVCACVCVRACWAAGGPAFVCGGLPRV